MVIIMDLLSHARFACVDCLTSWTAANRVPDHNIVKPGSTTDGRLLAFQSHSPLKTVVSDLSSGAFRCLVPPHHDLLHPVTVIHGNAGWVDRSHMRGWGQWEIAIAVESS